MGRKSRGKGKGGQADGPTPPVDRGTLAQCLNATSQIAAECNSILRDLLRGRSPQHQDLQRLASQVLMGQTMNLQELQKKMESQQATLAELLKVLKPASGPGGLDLAAHDQLGYSLPEPSVSVIKGWDSQRDAALGGAAAVARRRRTQKGSGERPSKDPILSKRERYLAVEGHWRAMAAEDRRAILAAPVSTLLEVAAAEGGPEARREVADGLKLLRLNASRHACYWRCPCCDLRTPDPGAFLAHLAAFHEEVQYSTEDAPVSCTTCGQEVVGAFFHDGPATAPTATQCLKCAWDCGGGAAAVNGGVGALTPPPGWALHVPQPTPLLERSWSGSLASTEALTASSGGASAGSSLASSASDGEEEGGDGSGGALTPAAEATALEARVCNGADGLLAAIAQRIDALAKANRPQFEVALTGVVQRAQRLMHAPPSLTGGAEEDEGAEGRTPEARLAAAEHLQGAPPPAATGPGDTAGAAAEDAAAEALRGALLLLSPSELQDLLALMARRYSPHPNHHGGGHKTAYDASYEPMCWSLLQLRDAGGNVVSGADAKGNGPSAADGAVVPAGATPAAAAPGAGLEGLLEAPEDAVVEAQAWWAEHLAEKGWTDLNTRDDAYLLQWVYGNVAHGATDEFLERQRLACGTKSADAAVVDSLAEMAETWRHLAATMDRRRHVATLRDAVAEDVEAVSAFDAATATSLRTQALAFFEEVGADTALAAAAAGDGPMDAAWSQRALGKLQRFHELKDEGSIRYAQALIDREIAVLELAEVMDQHELDVAERELSTVDAALAGARQDLADAEAELTRAQAEGPALHRKRDLLDRVNKEAEHRERLQELQTHMSNCRERIASEEAYGASARKRREEAAGDLDEGRAELQGYLERRQALDRACHAVLAAQERDRGQELTDAYVDARIRAVWQVVAGVADAIRGLHDRYAPGATSKEATRHARCTSLATQLAAELDERVRVWWEELDKLRRRTADLACVDAGQAVEAAALEAVRQALEGRAAAAREAAIDDLLQELEAEEAAKKAAESKKAKKKEKGKAGKKGGKDDGGKGGGGGAGADGAGADGGSGDVSGGEGDGEEDEAIGDLDPESEYEAALERRRQELERQEAERLRAEAELIRQAQEASLKEPPSATGPANGGPMVLPIPIAGVKKGKVAVAVVAVPVPPKAAKNAGSAATATLAPKSPAKPTPRVVIVQRNPAGGASGRAKAVEVIKTTVPAAKGDQPPPPPPPPPGKPIVVAVPTAAGAAAGSGTSTAIKTGEMRIITYYGDWICFCGRTNRLWDTCVCGQIPPCRDWVRGRCTYRDRCRFAHPPFELPDSLPRPKSPIAKPGPDATVYKKASGAHAKPGPVPVPIPVPIRHGVATPDAKPAAGAPKSAAPVAAAKAAVAPAPPPLKPAPWASVRPGAPVPGPAGGAPAAAAAGQSLGGGMGHAAQHMGVPGGYTAEEAGMPPPLLSPGGPSLAAALQDSAGLGSPTAAAQAGLVHPGSSDFNPFGSSLLMPSLSPAAPGQPPAPATAAQLSSAFTSLHLGPSLTQTSPSDAASASQLFGGGQAGSGAGLGGGAFLGGGLPSGGSGTNPGAAVFQPSGLGSSLGGYGAAAGGPPPPPGMSSGALGVGMMGGLGQQSAFGPPTGMVSLGGGLGSGLGGGGGAAGGGVTGGGAAGAGEYDDWADLQLQLPSDLGEMLGADPVASPPQGGAQGPGLYGNGPAGGGWGAF